MNKVSEWYDNLSNIQITQDIKILEIGCDRNYLGRTVIDISPKTIQLARQTKFLVMDAHNLQFPHKSFDKVYAHGSLESISAIGLVFQQVSRIMKQGAEFVFTVQREAWWISLYRKFFRKPNPKDRYFSTRQYKLSAIKALLNENDLKIKQVSYLYFGSIYLITACK